MEAGTSDRPSPTANQPDDRQHLRRAGQALRRASGTLTTCHEIILHPWPQVAWHHHDRLTGQRPEWNPTAYGQGMRAG